MSIYRAEKGFSYLLKILLLISLGFFSSSSHSSTQALTNQSIQNFIENQKLYEDQSWLTLIGIKTTIRNHKKYFIPTEDSDYFYLTNIKQQTFPKDEMLATVKALLEKAGNDYICKYPAKSTWLIKKLSPLLDHINLTHCRNLNR